MADYKVNTVQAKMDRTGLAFSVSGIHTFAGIFSNMYSFIPALGIFRRESQNKLYGALTFYFTHGFYEFPFYFSFVNLFTLLAYWTVDIRNDSFEIYVQWVMLFFVIRFAAGGLGDMLSLVLLRIEVVNQSFSLLVIPMMLVSGFIANIKSVIGYMIVYSYISPFRFGFQGAVEIEFTDDVIADYIRNCRIFNSECGDKSNPKCYFDFAGMPDSVKRPDVCNPRYNLDFYENAYMWDILILIAIGIFFRIFAVIAAFYFARETNTKNSPLPKEHTAKSSTALPLQTMEKEPLLKGKRVEAPENFDLPSEDGPHIVWNGNHKHSGHVDPTLNPNVAADQQAVDAHQINLQ